MIPKSWTAFVGISDGAYHVFSATAGTLAGVATVAGMVILLYRRFTVSAVRKATTRGDKVMYAFLAAAIVTGMFNTVGENVIGGGYDYRASVSAWFRGLFTFSGQPELMADVPLSFQVHNVVVIVLLGIWPYTRLVHVFSAPLGYLVRPYVSTAAAIHSARTPVATPARGATSTTRESPTDTYLCRSLIWFTAV